MKNFGNAARAKKFIGKGPITIECFTSFSHSTRHGNNRRRGERAYLLEHQIIFMTTPGAPSSSMARIVERNIHALMERRQQQERHKSGEESIADKVTGFTGSMPFVYLHLALFGAWILWNLGLFGLPPFDPSFVVLAMFASVEAIFLSTFVLISQNRMAAKADQRAELDLQVSLLAEHEITRLLTLVTAISKKLDIQEANDGELEELAKDIRPEVVLNTIEEINK